MITSTGNARVKQLVTWQKKRKARDEEGVYIVEGIRMYREAPRAQVREVYVSEQFYSRYGEELGLSAWGRQMEILSDHVFSHVSDTKTPQGILLVMEQRSCEICEMLDLDAQGRKPLLMVLDNLQDPGNLGTILRAGEAAGVTGVIMSHDCVDIYNPKTIRSTMGSIFRVPFFVTEDLHETIRQLQNAQISVYAAHLEGSVCYDTPDYTKGTAFLIGNEGNGLTKETAALADTYIRIPMGGQLESLNAAMAAGILMYEANRQRRV